MWSAWGLAVDDTGVRTTVVDGCKCRPRNNIPALRALLAGGSTPVPAGIWTSYTWHGSTPRTSCRRIAFVGMPGEQLRPARRTAPSAKRFTRLDGIKYVGWKWTTVGAGGLGATRSWRLAAQRAANRTGGPGPPIFV